MRMLSMRMNRLPPKRKRVLQALADRRDHPSAEDLYRSLASQGEEISLATVYRALGALAEDGLVAELRLGGPARYDPVVEPHHHFSCRRCGGLFDVAGPRVRPHADGLLPGFVAEGYSVTWTGLCPACAQAKEGNDGQRRARDGGKDWTEGGSNRGSSREKRRR